MGSWSKFSVGKVHRIGYKLNLVRTKLTDRATMDTEEEKKPAEKITDQELLIRVDQALHSKPAPFITVKDIDSVVPELGYDQTRERLKELSEEDDNLVYTQARGLVFWTVEDREPPEEMPIEMPAIVAEEERMAHSSYYWGRVNDFYGKIIQMFAVMFIFPLVVAMADQSLDESYIAPQSTVEEFLMLSIEIGVFGLILTGPIFAALVVCEKAAERDWIPGEPFEYGILSGSYKWARENLR